LPTDKGHVDEKGAAGTDEGMLAALDHRRLRPKRERHKARLKWLAIGERSTPPTGYRGLYERPMPAEPEDVGICCSGGGIRSAAFNLGALQKLQEETILQRSKYLSAVSGGSYIAAAFCMVAKTWPTEEDLEKPEFREKLDPDDLATGVKDSDNSDPALVTDDDPPFQEGSPEEQYLRNHLGYLAPDGLARVYLALRMLAGMLVNVVIVGLPVFVIGVLGGWAVSVHYGGLEEAFHFPQGVWMPVVAVAGLSLVLALLGILVRPRRDWIRLFLETWQVRMFLLACAGAVTLIGVPWVARTAFVSDDPSSGDAAGPGVTAVSSMAALAIAALAQVRGHVKDQQKTIKAVQGRLSRWAKPVREALVSLVVILVGPLLLVAICALGVLVGDIAAGADDPVGLGPLGDVRPLFVWVGVSTLALFFLWLWVDLTSVSLHPFYRQRLASAFALRRVAGDDGPEARKRRYDKIVQLSKSGIEPGPCVIKSWPMLIVCAAANISDPGATPPGRGVASFTFSPNAIGGPVTGAEETRVYEKRKRARDVTLPAAVAMSGAALSPSMGKMTYRPLMFLLGLANIRLGVWVPNPLHVNAPKHVDASKTKQPPARFPGRPRPHYLLKEMLGRNRLEDKFLYVTDGGHYENLGLVELVRRGCRTIYCLDAGGGSSAQALVDAIALCRTELNVTIVMRCEADELDAKPISKDEGAPWRAKSICSYGTIEYPGADGNPPVTGTLVYARSVVTDHAPWQIRSFQATDPVFPHHSTMDQFFDDQKFEAYRLLGAYAAGEAIALAGLAPRRPPRRTVASAAPRASAGREARAGTGTRRRARS
jgi:Patatin-like phospholipase